MVDQSFRRYLKTKSELVNQKGISVEKFFEEVNKLAIEHPSAEHKVEKYEKPVMFELVRCAGFGSLVDQLRYDDKFPLSFSEITIIKDEDGRYGTNCYSNAEFILEGINCKNLWLDIDSVSEIFYPDQVKTTNAEINGKTKSKYLALIRVLAEAAEFDIDKRGLASALVRAAEHADCRIGHDFIVAALRDSSNKTQFDLTSGLNRKKFLAEVEKFK